MKKRIPQPLRGHVFVQIDKEYQDTVKSGNLEITIDIGHETSGYYVTTFGTIASVAPDLEGEVFPGDKVYFDYKSIDSEHPQDCVELDGEKYYLVPVIFLFCVVRQGQITMLGGRVLCEAVYEEGVEEAEIDGKKMMIKTSSSGLVVETNCKHDEQRAKLVHIGNRIPGNEILEVGDIVHYAQHADDEYEIEGKKYFVMRQSDIYGKEL